MHCVLCTNTVHFTLDTVHAAHCIDMVHCAFFVQERQVLRLSVSPSDVSQHTKQQLMDMVKVQQSSVNFHVCQAVMSRVQGRWVREN